MHNNISFDFTVDKETKTVFITRTFDAGLSLVWEAFTKPELLDQWGAPEPWKTETLRMDFKVGGRRFYKMISPDGQEFYSVQDFTSITPKTNYKYISGLSDKEENLHPDFYGSENDLTFNESNGITNFRMTIKYKDLNTLEMMANEMFKQGMKLALDIVEKLLAAK
ncbi:MAG: SRPBCC domain-containing protein [Bacteroidia bacterium]